MEGIDLRSIDFAIMNCLNSNSFGPKRMACLTIPVSVDPKSLSLFMATNLFKKVNSESEILKLTNLISFHIELMNASLFFAGNNEIE